MWVKFHYNPYKRKRTIFFKEKNAYDMILKLNYTKFCG